MRCSMCCSMCCSVCCSVHFMTCYTNITNSLNHLNITRTGVLQCMLQCVLQYMLQCVLQCAFHNMLYKYYELIKPSEDHELKESREAFTIRNRTPDVSRTQRNVSTCHSHHTTGLQMCHELSETYIHTRHESFTFVTWLLHVYNMAHYIIFFFWSPGR